MINIDLHAHTTYSGDSRISPEKLVDQLLYHPFVKGIAVTDHDTMRGYHHVKKLTKFHEELIIIPGIELSTPQGHIILLGLEKEPGLPMTVHEAVELAIKNEWVIIIPHPFRRGTGIAEIAKEVRAHAVEVFNPRMSKEDSDRAVKLAKSISAGMVAGSDCHIESDLWTYCTQIDSSPNLSDVLESIRRGKTKPVSRKSFSRGEAKFSKSNS